MDTTLSVNGSCIGGDVTSLLIFVVIFIVTTDYVKNRQPSTFPPGPPALPVLGNMFTVDFSKTHESLTQLGRKYGDVFSIRMGSVWIVVLNSFDVLKEALVTKGDSVAERPDLPLQVEVVHKLGINFSHGNTWRQQRRFALTTLRNFGFGKKSLEPVILDEFTYCAEHFLSKNGEPFNPHLTMNNAVANIICSLVFGHRFEYSDERFLKMVKLFELGLQIQASIWAQFYNSFPWLMKYLPGPHQTVQNMWHEVKDFIRDEIKEHKQNWDPSNQRDYIDCYLNEIEMNKGQPDNTFDEETLVMSILDLFVAGSETTSSTLRWAFLHMADNPDIQAKVHAEIDTVIGQSRRLCMEDRVNLPYTDAVIHEALRMGNIVPLSLPRFTNKDLQLGDYIIPKGVTIIPNLSSVMFDKNEWETPFTFNPRHFLTEEGKFVKKPSFIPFSAGKRICPGETLTKMELFLFFSSFMQHFNFSMPAGVKPTIAYTYGIVLTPRPYEICVTRR